MCVQKNYMDSILNVQMDQKQKGKNVEIHFSSKFHRNFEQKNRNIYLPA